MFLKPEEKLSLGIHAENPCWYAKTAVVHLDVI